MHRRPLQLGNMILPNNTIMVEEETENNFMLEYAITDGGKIFNTRPKISAKNISLNGTFFNPLDLPVDSPFIIYQNGERVLKDNFYKFLHKLAQKTTDILAIGIDDKIYRQRVRVGLPLWGELFNNSFDWTVTLVGPDTFWEDVTDRAFYYFNNEIVDNKAFWKYNGELTYLDFNTPKFGLVILDPPASFDAYIQNYANSLKVWNTSLIDNYYLYLDGNGVYYSLDNTFLLNAVQIINQPVDAVNSNIDTLFPDPSYTYTSTSTLNTQVISLSNPINLFQFEDGSPVNFDHDTIDFGLFVANKSVLTTFTLELHKSPAEYMSVNIINDGYPFWNLTKHRFSEFTNVNFDGICNFIVIKTQDNGTHTKIKFNDFFAAKNFGAFMNYIPGNNKFIPNESGKIEIKVLAYFNVADTLKRLTVNNKAINITNNTDRVIIVADNSIFTGPDIFNLNKIDNFKTMLEDDLSITTQSNLTSTTHYIASPKYL